MTTLGFTQTIPQRLALLVTLVASVLAVAYPGPAFYEWSHESFSWQRTDTPVDSYAYLRASSAAKALWQRYYKPDRRLIFEYGLYGQVRADFRRMAVEVGLILLAGSGFIWAVRPSQSD